MDTVVSCRVICTPDQARRLTASFTRSKRFETWEVRSSIHRFGRGLELMS